MCGGGGGGPTETTQTVTTLPDYLEPDVKALVARASYESSRPYEQYQGQRIAYFSPMEQEAMARIGALGVSGTSPELQYAGKIAAGLATNPGINTNVTSTYNPSAISSSYSPDTRSSGYVAGQRDMGYRPGSILSDYSAGQLDDSAFYQGGQREMGFEPGTLADQDMLQTYMSPYYQSVVDIQKREAARQADMRNSQIGLEAAGQGSLGGYREAMIRAENERNLMQEMGDIQQEGSQAAFLNAQQAYEADRAARVLAEQFGQSQFVSNEQIKQRMAELMMQGFSVNEAARQVEQQLKQSAFGLTESAKQAQEQFGQSQFGLNQSALQTQEQLTQSQFGMNQANQQAAAALQLQAYQASQQAMQQAQAMKLDAAQIAQAGQIAAAEVMQRGVDQLSGYAQQQQDMEMARLNAMGAVGGQQRALYQQGLDTAYQDFMRQQAYPKEQLSFLSNIIQGNMMQPGETTTTYGPSPNAWQSLLGAGVAGAGLYGAAKASGGRIPNPRSSGVAGLGLYNATKG